MYYVTKRLQDASIAHRLGKGYTKKCKNLHSHVYRFEVTLRAGILDHYDMVVDFGTIKTLFSDWIQEHWDHATVVSNSDTPLLVFLKKEKQRHFCISADRNSTAEYMAKFLFERFAVILQNVMSPEAAHIGGAPLSNKPELVSVRVWETEDSYAEYRKD